MHLGNWWNNDVNAYYFPSGSAIGGMRVHTGVLSAADVANNYAATLVVTGRKPAEAVKLTFENLSKFPGSPDFQINHAIALLLNDRAEEAQRILVAVDGDKLTAVQRANFHLAWLDVSVRARRWSDARERGLLIDRSQLMPLQLAKLEVLQKQALRAN